MAKLKIGIVGAGNIANAHLAAYRNVDDAEIAAICDINKVRLNETADLFGIEKRYLSEDEMIAKENLDAADICVYNRDHAKCTVTALQSGLHVLCEKPMAYSSKEAQEMKDAAERNNKLLMIGFVLRFSDNACIARDFINSGTLGEIYHTKATYLRRHGAPGGWFCNRAISGGGPVIDLGVHVIDLTRYMMGSPKPVSVYSVTQNKLANRANLKTDVAWKPRDAKDDDIYDVEDFGTAIIRYDNGATTLLETSYSLNGEEKTSQEFFGTKGGIKLDESGFKIYGEMNDYIVDIIPKTDNLKGGGDMFVSEMRHFVNCAAGREKCIATADDGIDVMKILEAIYESARTGHEVIL